MSPPNQMDGNSSWISLVGRVNAIWKIKGLSARPSVEWRNVQNKTCSVYNKVMDWRANGQTRHGLYLKVFNTRDGVTCCDATFTSMLQTRSKQQLLNLTDILVGVIRLEIPAQSLACARNLAEYMATSLRAFITCSPSLLFCFRQPHHANRSWEGQQSFA